MLGRGLLLVLLASTAAHADPEGYRGGEDRPPGTTYNPPDGAPSLTVRGVTFERGRSDGRWTCGGIEMLRGSEDLVTVTLVISNPSKQRIARALALIDLVFDDSGLGVAEGSCVRDERENASADLGAGRRRTVQKRFFISRGATPKVLVYNDDDFPALFALPRARRISAAR